MAACLVETLAVRPMQREDIATLAATTADEVTRAQLDNRWREQETGYRELFVATLDGRPVGNVSLRVVGAPRRTVHLFALEVATELRGRGIGRRLVEFVLEEARRRGGRRVFLEVRVDNPARRLYHRLGFRRVGPDFVNTWWRYNDDGTQERVDEPSLRMVRRVSPQTS